MDSYELLWIPMDSYGSRHSFGRPEDQAEVVDVEHVDEKTQEAKDEEDKAQQGKAEEKQAEEQEVACLEKLMVRGEAGFERWLKGLDIKVLQAAFSQACLTNKNAEELQAYVAHIQAIQTIQVCAKCRYSSGCVACSYQHALRYVLRQGKPPEWWRRSTQSVLRGMCRLRGDET